MKIFSPLRLAIATVGFAVSAIAGHTETPNAPAPLPPTDAVVITTVSAGGPIIPVQFATAADPVIAPVQWIEIRDYTCEKRDLFFAGFKRLEAMLNDQTNELTARRGARHGATDIKTWELAMKEMEMPDFS